MLVCGVAPYLVPATFLGSKAVESRALLAGVRSRIHMPAMRYSMVSSCPVRPITSASMAKQWLSSACAWSKHPCERSSVLAVAYARGKGKRCIWERNGGMQVAIRVGGGGRQDIENFWGRGMNKADMGKGLGDAGKGSGQCTLLKAKSACCNARLAASSAKQFGNSACQSFAFGWTCRSAQQSMVAAQSAK